MRTDEVVIDWNYAGKPDVLLGNGATAAERLLVLAGAAAAVAACIWQFSTGAVFWSGPQLLIAVVICADVCGGVVANSLNSCKRFYHTPPKADESGMTRLAKNHLFFSALHVYPLLLALVFSPTWWGPALLWYFALLLSAVVVMALPLYLRRPGAMLIIAVCLILNGMVIAPVSGFQWFIPALFIKIVYGHLVREEPYRPATAP
jgi:hypothetical protein